MNISARSARLRAAVAMLAVASCRPTPNEPAGASPAPTTSSGTERSAEPRNQSFLSDIVQVDSHRHGTCALRSDGTVWCWGLLDAGERGFEDEPFFGLATPTPVEIEAIEQTQLRQVRLRRGELAAVDATGQLLLAGSTRIAVVANDETAGAFTPTASVSSFDRWRETQPGAMHLDPPGSETMAPRLNSKVLVPAGLSGVALPLWTSSDETVCWISGPSTLECSPSPEPAAKEDSASPGRRVLLPPDMLFDGDAPVCLARPTQLRCSFTPECPLASLAADECEGTLSAPLPARPVRLYSTSDFACALLETGEILCFALAGPKSDQTLLRARRKGTFTDLAVGNSVCGLQESGEVLCFGIQRFDDTNPDFTDYPVDAPGRLVQISAGSNHGCGLADDGRVACWGLNQKGQLGTGRIGDTHDVGEEEGRFSARWVRAPDPFAKVVGTKAAAHRPARGQWTHESVTR